MKTVEVIVENVGIIPTVTKKEKRKPRAFHRLISSFQ